MTSDEDLETHVSELAKNLEDMINVKYSLDKLYELKAPLDVYKKYDVKSLTYKYLEDEECANSAKSMKQLLKQLKKERKTEKKQQTNFSNFAPKLEQKNLEEWMRSDSEDDDETVENVTNNRKRPFEMSEMNSEKKMCVPISIDMFKEDDEKKARTEKQRQIDRANREKQMKQSTLGSQQRIIAKLETGEPEILSQKQKAFNQEQMFKPRRDHRRVFAGTRKTFFVDEVSPLIKIAQMSLTQNPTFLLRFCNYAPYDLLEPAFNRFTDEQKLVFIKNNPNYIEETEDAFKQMIEKEFPEMGPIPEEYDYWYEYYEALKERKKKLESEKLSRLTFDIAKKAAKTDTGRKTKLIEEAHLPRFVRQRQEKNGLSFSAKPMPSAKDLSQARKAVGQGNYSKLNAMPRVVVGRNSQLGASKAKPKPAISINGTTTGYLWRKTKKMLNSK